MRWGPGDGDELEVLPVDDLSPFARGGRAAVDGGGGADDLRAPVLLRPIIELSDSDLAGLLSAHRPPHRRYRVALAAVIALFVAAVGSLLVVPGSASPAQTWADVREFVDSHDTAHFTDSLTTHFGDVDSALGETSTSRSFATGEVRLPGESRTVINSGEDAEEILVIGDSVYARYADTLSELRDARWTVVHFPGADGWTGEPHVDWGGDHEEFEIGWDRSVVIEYAPSIPDDLPPPPVVDGSPEIGASGGGHPPPMPPEQQSPHQRPDLSYVPREARVAMARAFGIGSGMGMTFDLRALLASAKNVEAAETNQLRATVDWRDLVPGSVQRMIPHMPFTVEGAVTLLVQYGPRGRLDRLTLDSTLSYDGDRQIERHEMVFSKWGEPVDVERPDAEAVDLTPEIDEEGIERARMPVLAPSFMPPGWVLASADVMPHDSSIEVCESVTLEYVKLDGPVDRHGDPPTLTVTSVEPFCSWGRDLEPDLRYARTVVFGQWQAQVVNGVHDNTYSYLAAGVTAVLDMGATHLLVSTNMGEEFLMTTLHRLERIRLDMQPVAGVAADVPRD